MVFKSYSNYYDTLYDDKDYNRECDFLEEIFRKYSSSKIKNILDLGCGTCVHAILLANRGYNLTGVDLSKEMLDIAKKKTQKQNLDLDLHQGDLRTFVIPKKFDAVIAMFAVMGYQVTNDDLQNAFKTAKKHLNPDGLFIFDFWFGPAVLTDRPVDRFKIIEKNKARVIRFATPSLDILNHTVDVNYKILELKDKKVLNEVDEIHKMRYLFPQEINYLAKYTGFKLLSLCPFLKQGELPSERDWNVTAILRNSYS